MCAPNTDAIIDLAPFPSHFLPNGQAIFPPSNSPWALRIMNHAVFPDTVIYATGFQTALPFLDKSYPTPKEADLRSIAQTGSENFAYIGFLRPGLGAIPPIAEMQAMFWIQLLKGSVVRPLSSPNYRLIVKETARITHGVNHALYVSTLAKDIGAAPGLFELWWNYGTRVLVSYALGAPFTPFYRLIGPYSFPDSAKIAKTELWDTIARRGIIMNLLLGVLPMCFYLTLNAIVYILDTLVKLSSQLWNKLV
ncbi:hypothetical protein M422DRAFT_270149 [Sphaerobolus stellatus SS14]|uniref:Unplaced genomic scaffold SPHSTscaffold_228, whole genome shotgun sequence n=1 Tax=Sphaerobolus stellatus (strain SS14) TaxID=990650 RepID=A0A0C9UHY0_SPHS4|nr:hypothetical protein M422DRAFT_270149 [Sphaerobolus stellatus SS14]